MRSKIIWQIQVCVAQYFYLGLQIDTVSGKGANSSVIEHPSPS